MEKQSLVIRGKVEKFAEVNPKRLRINGEAGQKIVETVTIIPLEKYPFAITEAKPKKGENIKVQLSEKNDKKGLKYLLTVTNLRDTPGRYYDLVEIKTTSKVQPLLKITVYGNIEEAGTKNDKPGSKPVRQKSSLLETAPSVQFSTPEKALRK